MFNIIKLGKMDWQLWVLIFGILVLFGTYMATKKSDSDDDKYKTGANAQRVSVAENASNERDKILKNTEIQRFEAEAERFFRERNFEMFSNFFAGGHTITRYFNNGKYYSMASKTKVVTYENAEFYFEVKGNKGTLIKTGEEMDMRGNRIEGMVNGQGGLDISRNAMGRFQKTKFFMIDNLCHYFVLIEKDEESYTYAIGKAPCS